MPFDNLETIQPKEILPGYTVRFVHSNSMTFAFWDVKEGSPLPEHSHHHEQVAQVIEGEYELTVAGETKRLKPGDVAIIPSNVLHSGVAITACKLMDVFCPVREDYLNTSS
ncbi:cupin domain-containing protein [Ekhidna sp. To15]|uniref:cupin domain-containing protein n=1 Tax=Ekhidna sp. To15 TaxID=3395267 RepID=UPI003F5290A2